MAFKKSLKKVLPNPEDQVQIPIKDAHSLEISPICKTEKEYTDRMVLSIGGLHRKIGILKRPDVYGPEDIIEEKLALESVGAELIIPSIIKPLGLSNPDWITYLVLFTHDKKLFVCPADFDSFSDMRYGR